MKRLQKFDMAMDRHRLLFEVYLGALIIGCGQGTLRETNSNDAGSGDTATTHRDTGSDGDADGDADTDNGSEVETARDAAVDDTETDSTSDTASDEISDGTCRYECVARCHFLGGTFKAGTCKDDGLWCCDLGSAGGGETDTIEADSDSETETQGTAQDGPCRPAPKTYRNLFTELLSVTEAEVDAKLEAAFQQLFHGNGNQSVYYESGADEAYIVDIKHNDVRSEGMSYGMIIAVQMDKQEEFNRLWKWSTSHMQQWSGYFAWQASTSGWVMDSNSAPDGEEYFATALVFAANRWGDGDGIYAYSSQALSLLKAMANNGMFDWNNKMVKFLVNKNYTDPSYILPAFYEVWACYDLDNQARWRSAADAARAFFPKAVNSNTGLAPDQCGFDGNANGSNFTYDAWRVVVNIMMDYHFYHVDSRQVTYAKTLGKFFAGQGEHYSDTYTLDGRAMGSEHRLGLISCNATLGFALPEADAVPFVRELWEAEIESGQDRYYQGMLQLLALLHVSGRFKLWY